MKNFNSLLGILFASFLCFFSCSVENEDDPVEKVDESYMVFGHFYGFCQGEQCIEIFKIMDGKLYEDTNDHYPTSQGLYEGEFIELSAAKYEMVSDLKAAFPFEKLRDSKTVIGQPDAGDWGGMYVEYHTGGDEEPKFWLLDLLDSNTPEHVSDFVNLAQEKIEMINE